MSEFADGFLEWQSRIPLTNAGTITIALGNQNSGTAVIDVKNSVYFNFGIIAQLACNLIIDVSVDPTFAAFSSWITFPVPANTYQTVYDLPAPLNNTGKLVLNYLYMRIRLTDTGLGNHTFTNFYAKAWR